MCSVLVFGLEWEDEKTDSQTDRQTDRQTERKSESQRDKAQLQCNEETERHWKEW
jgi:hypothetical protein